MRIVFTPDEVKSAVDALRAQLTDTFSKRGPVSKWIVPPGTELQLDTWEASWKCRTLKAIGIGKKPGRKCTFVCLAAEGRSGVWTPTVEINIPDGRATPDRKVMGCISVDGPIGNTTRWIGHRGTKMTVDGNQHIPKEDIHREFHGWLRQGIQDGDKNADIIFVGQIGPSLIDKLDDFVEAVQRLKQSWPSKP